MSSFFTTGYGQVLIVFAILFLTHIITRLIRKLLNFYFEKHNKRHQSRVSLTQQALVRHFIGFIIYLLGIGVAIYTVPSLRSLSISLFAGAGVLAIIVGFASREAFSNIVSGIFIGIFIPFRVGDIISLKDDILGVVEDINMRHTTLRTFENKRVIIPNMVMNDAIITNFSINDEQMCRFVDFDISYDSDIDLAMKIMQEQAEKHPYCLDIRTGDQKKQQVPKVTVRVIKLGEHYIRLRAWVWAANPSEAFVLGCDLNKSIKEEFDAQGVEIPFPYRTMVMKKDLPKAKKLSAKQKKAVQKRFANALSPIPKAVEDDSVQKHETLLNKLANIKQSLSSNSQKEK
ncbi:MAG: mechanosensitive ion channel family protein [Candidatus Woesearchaeota archaeon]